MKFREKWLDVVKEKNSVLCAGLDPAEYAMGRGDKGLSQDVDKLKWAMEYIGAVAPYCAALKPNIQYWKNPSGMADLELITEFAKDKGLIVIEDSKLPDIGSTNDAGFFYGGQKNVDAITYSPFAGNIGEAANQAHARNLGIINMCLMSNPEYKREKNKLVKINDETDYYYDEDVKHIDKERYVKQYIQLAKESYKYGIDGIVIGAPSKKNHILEEEIKNVRKYVGGKMLVLLPGVGAQGGEAGEIWKYFGKDNVVVNVGRSVMFPNGSKSTVEEQAKQAKYFQGMLNDLRA